MLSNSLRFFKGIARRLRESHFKRALIVTASLTAASLLTACANSNASETSENQHETKGSEIDSQNESRAASSEGTSTSDFKVTLLGTGSPIPSIERFSASTLVEAGGEKLLFDAGRGSSIRLLQLGIEAGEIDKIFLTHLHHDHTVGLPDILITGSVPIPDMGGRQEALQVWGPLGTQNMVDGFYQAYAKDVTNRQSVAKSKAGGLDTDVHEIEEGIIYDHAGVKVTAFEIDHGSMKPSLGFRVDYNGKSVVLSGDTTYSDNLIKYGEGTDLIIHEVIATESEDKTLSDTFDSIASYHTTPEQAAEVFKAINPQLAVYTHIISLGMTDEEADFIGRTNKIYDGEVVLGEDLMTFEIDDEIKVKRLQQ